MLIFYSEAKKAWVERVKLPNGKTKEITAKTEKLLVKKLVEFDANLTNGRTFSECADGWESAHENKVEETTAQSYSPHVRRAKDYFEGRYIKDITPDEVQGYVDYLVELDFSKDTVRRGLVVVNKIFKWAITRPDSIIRFNPCSCVEIPRGLKQAQRDPPTEEQIAKITPDTEMGLFAYFLLCTGLRPCELLALRWEDIDREERKIHVNKSATYANNNAVVKDRTKTAAGMRTVPLVHALDSILKYKKSGYVFGGEKPYKKQDFYRGWSKWCCDIGIGHIIEEEHTSDNGHKYTKHIYKADVTPYQFRHEYASILEDIGVSEFDAQHIMGHASIVTTKDKYTKFREKKDKQLNALNKLDRHFDGR